jgi:hypothetical protein
MWERTYETGNENYCVDFSAIPPKFKVLFLFRWWGGICIYKTTFSPFSYNMYWHYTFLAWGGLLWIAKFLPSVLFCDTPWAIFSMWRPITRCLAMLFQFLVAVLPSTFYPSTWRLQCSTRDRLERLKSEYLTYWPPPLSCPLSMALQLSRTLTNFSVA